MNEIRRCGKHIDGLAAKLAAITNHCLGVADFRSAAPRHNTDGERGRVTARTVRDRMSRATAALLGAAEFSGVVAMGKIAQVEADPDLKLDQPIRGAKNIARVLNFLDEKGEPNARQAYYLLQTGVLDADKVGHAGNKKNGDKPKTQWWSTKRRLLKIPRGA
jgi:hypothetical protein